MERVESAGCVTEERDGGWSLEGQEGGGTRCFALIYAFFLLGRQIDMNKDLPVDLTPLFGYSACCRRTRRHRTTRMPWRFCFLAFAPCLRAQELEAKENNGAT